MGWCRRATPYSRPPWQWSASAAAPSWRAGLFLLVIWRAAAALLVGVVDRGESTPVGGGGAPGLFPAAHVYYLSFYKTTPPLATWRILITLQHSRGDLGAARPLA